MSNGIRVPLVRPPQYAQGGGSAPAFGGSGAPAVPVPGSRRARMLDVQYADDERGRFTERVFVFPQFTGLVAGGSTVSGAQISEQLQVMASRSSFQRLVAIRAVLTATTNLPLTGLELAQLLLSFQINGEEEMTTGGELSSPASLATLFANQTAPWFWFACPPRLRTGDMLQAVVTNNAPAGGGSPVYGVEVACRLVDDDWWTWLYGGGSSDDGDYNGGG